METLESEESKGHMWGEKNQKGKVERMFQAWACPVPFLSLSHLISVLAARFYESFPNRDRGPKLGDLAFIYILTGFGLLLLPLFFLENREQDGISRGQKETEQESLKQQNPWASFPQGTVWLPCGFNVFVRPSPLITIMSLERAMRAEFVCVHAFLQSVEDKTT